MTRPRRGGVAPWIFVLGVLILPAAEAGGQVEGGPCLEIYREGARIHAVDLDAPLEFTVSWIHSVEHEQWQEQFVADPAGEIRIESTRFRTFGAGVPDTAPETHLADGWVIMSGFDRVVDPLFVRANAETSHTLILGNDILPMEPGQYRFSVGLSCNTSH